MISDVVGFSGGGGGRATGAYPVAAVRHCEHGRGGGGGEAEREEEREEPARGVRGEEGGRARHKRARSRGAAVRRWMELTGWRPAAWRKVRVVRNCADAGVVGNLGFAGFGRGRAVCGAAGAGMGSNGTVVSIAACVSADRIGQAIASEYLICQIFFPKNTFKTRSGTKIALEHLLLIAL